MIKKTKEKILFDCIAGLIIAGFAFACLLPFYLVIVSSFTSEKSIINEGFSLYIRDFSLSGYESILKNPMTILQTYGVTILVTVGGSLCAVYMALSTGYVLSRKDFPWRNGFSFIFFFTTLFNGGLVPYYIWVSRYMKLSNTIFALILPMMFSVWNMIIAKNYIRNLPFEIIESVKVDGAGDFTIFTRIILPLSKPLVATLVLFTAIGYWNDWYNCMLFVKNRDLYTLQYFLQDMLNSADALRRVANKSGMNVKSMPMESMKMAMTVVATGPIIVLYPFVQKYFVKGLTVGAVKG